MSIFSQVFLHCLPVEDSIRVVGKHLVYHFRRIKKYDVDHVRVLLWGREILPDNIGAMSSRGHTHRESLLYRFPMLSVEVHGLVHLRYALGLAHAPDGVVPVLTTVEMWIKGSYSLHQTPTN